MTDFDRSTQSALDADASGSRGRRAGRVEEVPLPSALLTPLTPLLLRVSDKKSLWRRGALHGALSLQHSATTIAHRQPKTTRQQLARLENCDDAPVRGAVRG